MRARYAYDPFGRRKRLAGDMDGDFGFTGLFFAAEAGLSIARFRAYDPVLGRWLSRDPLRKAEIQEGPNLYAYVRNNPINATDLLGLCCEKEENLLVLSIQFVERSCEDSRKTGQTACQNMSEWVEGAELEEACKRRAAIAEKACEAVQGIIKDAVLDFIQCVLKGCDEPPPCPQCARNPITGMTHCNVGGR